MTEHFFLACFKNNTVSLYFRKNSAFENIWTDNSGKFASFDIKKFQNQKYEIHILQKLPKTGKYQLTELKYGVSDLEKSKSKPTISIYDDILDPFPSNCGSKMK